MSSRPASSKALASALPITSNAAGLGPIAAALLSTSEPPTSRRAVTTYNNFYELGTDKADPAENTFRLKPAGWTLRVEGLVNKPCSFSIDELIKLVPLEERIYRRRKWCGRLVDGDSVGRLSSPLLKQVPIPRAAPSTWSS